MIRFNCHCTHEFLVPEDQAGALVQCPKCGRLNDVPTLSDLEHLEDGGIFKMDEKPKPPSKNMIPEATRAFSRDLRDDHGEEIDLRPSVDDILAAGTTEIPLELAGQELPGTPKYDPVTGELIESIDIKPSDKQTVDAKKIPVAKRAITYAAGDLSKRVTPGRILLNLFHPVNLVVMLFVILAHMLLQVVLAVVMAGIFFAAPLVIIFGGLLVSHYGVIIEEIGKGDLDELPRPLRDASFGSDLWAPFIRFNFSILACFWPIMLVIHMPGTAGTGLLAACVLFGFYFFPATLLTTLCAGSYLNLRPDRIIGVIRACGLGYWVSVIAFAIGGMVYLGSIGFVTFAFIHLFASGPIGDKMLALAGGSTTLLLGIYLMHFACWHLGLLTRVNADRFPWVLQRHVHSRRTDTLAQLEAARKAARHADLLRANRPDRDARISEIREAEKAKRAAQEAKPIWDRVAETRND